MEKVKTKNCRVCSKPFKLVTEWQKYCGDKCRGKAANDRRLKMIRDYKRLIRQQEQVSP